MEGRPLREQAHERASNNEYLVFLHVLEKDYLVLSSGYRHVDS